MAGEFLLGVDIGTYSSKGVLCSPNGEVLATSTIEHEMSMPKPGWAEHDADAIWWGEFVAITRHLLSDRYSGDDIGAVAVSAIGGCMLPVDADGRPLRPGVLYGIDTRAIDEIAWLNDRFGEGPLFDQCGMALSSQAIGPKILWLRRNEPEIYARTHKVVTASSYLILQLTGEYVIDRHTGCYYNPLVDVRSLEWDGRFAEPIIELDRLPRLAWSDEVVGGVTAAAAAETGLRIGTPVTAGTVDAAAEAISVGVDEPGDMMIMYGTTMFFIQVTDRPIPDSRMWTTGYVSNGRFDITGGMSTSGALTRWFRDQLAGEELSGQKGGGAKSYAQLATLASSTKPGAGGVICLPYFSGERTPINDPLARGMFAGLTLSHTRAHLYRSVLEGTGFGVRDNLDTMVSMGVKPRRLVAVGGGSQNAVWLQIVSDITGRSQILPERTIGAAYGDAFLAGIASGIVKDRASLNRDWVTIKQMVEPNEEHASIYDSMFDIYRRLYKQTRSEMHALAALGQDRM